MAVEVERLARALRGFIATHRAVFDGLSNRRSQLLELGALTLAARHYEVHGYSVAPRNLRRGEFRVKLSTKGHPWNFSWFEATRDSVAVEIHGNLPVEDSFKTADARYVVDVAVVRHRSLPSDDLGRERWWSLRNRDLVTFVEAKSLVVYPMLLAQFVGIVHEIKPAFLEGRRPPGFGAADHFNPTLVSLGYLHGTCRGIVAGYRTRRCRIGVVPTFDDAITRLELGSLDSPFDDRVGTDP